MSNICSWKAKAGELLHDGDQLGQLSRLHLFQKSLIFYMLWNIKYGYEECHYWLAVLF